MAHERLAVVLRRVGGAVGGALHIQVVVPVESDTVHVVEVARAGLRVERRDRQDVEAGLALVERGHAPDRVGDVPAGADHELLRALLSAVVALVDVGLPLVLQAARGHGLLEVLDEVVGVQPSALADLDGARQSALHRSAGARRVRPVLEQRERLVLGGLPHEPSVGENIGVPVLAVAHELQALLVEVLGQLVGVRGHEVGVHRVAPEVPYHRQGAVRALACPRGHGDAQELRFRVRLEPLDLSVQAP